MAKKIFRSLALGIIVFAVAVLAGYLSYVITYRYQTQKVKESLAAQDTVAAAPVYGEAQPLSEDAVLLVDHYIARLENNNIAIYTSSGGKESFLYTLNIHPGDLTNEDMAQLTQGVILKDKQALTSFEEDFTS